MGLRSRRLLSVLAAVVSASTALVAVEVIVAAPAGAWNSLGCKQSGAQNSYDLQVDSGLGYVNAASDAAQAWTNTATPLTIYQGTGGAHFTIETWPFGDTGYDGIMLNSGCVNGHWFDAHAEWNTYYTNGYGPTAKKQVMVHEVGHVLGLAHAGTSACSGQPIMYFDTSRWFVCGHQNPQPDDINGINHLY